jgi:uncharacterized protein
MRSFKRIVDPVHGTVSLTELESNIIQTRAFQRLRNVKQLGLAHMVYPGADYSRFAHSIGACHIAGQILDVLEEKKELSFWSTAERIKNIQLLRVGALLHDVGHYPFSHTMEHAISDYYYQSWQEDSELGGGSFIAPLDHELVGKRIMEHDPEISKLLREAGITTKSLSALFRKEEGSDAKLTNLISADLDVDRLDYLQRTAYHTSLPYGRVEFRYLLSQVCVDNEFRFALTHKAMRTAEHLLLGRYFDYTQVTFHKTVAALEWLLTDVIHGLLKEGYIHCTQNDIVQQIESGSWHCFDDSYVLGQIRQFVHSTANQHGKCKAQHLLDRKTPALVAELELVANREYEREFHQFRNTVTQRLPAWAKEIGISEDFWHIWHCKQSLTSIGSDNQEDPDLQAKAEKSARILDAESKVSFPIISYRPSLMSVLGNYELFVLRIYVVIDEPDRMRGSIREKISEVIREDLPDAAWR